MRISDGLSFLQPVNVSLRTLSKQDSSPLLNSTPIAKPILAKKKDQWLKVGSLLGFAGPG